MESMRYWQHGETGRLCAMVASPSPRYYEITAYQYQAATTGTNSDPQVPDRRTGPIDLRLTEQLVHSLVGGRMWQKQRLVDYGRRSTDKR